MTRIAIIGGTGLTRLDTIRPGKSRKVRTRWGSPSAALVTGTLAGVEVIFLARHGDPHTIPPHRVNYRANIQALCDAGVERIVSVNAVGGISRRMTPCSVIVPDQIIDYTWSRDHTFFDTDLTEVTHIDFTEPYTESLRQVFIRTARKLHMKLPARATYGATQGPRLETPAEIRRMARDGCDLVGMTGMPEAALARELGLEYVSLCLVVNWAAGISDEPITMEIIHANLEHGMDRIRQLLEAAVPAL